MFQKRVRIIVSILTTVFLFLLGNIYFAVGADSPPTFVTSPSPSGEGEQSDLPFTSQAILYDQLTTVEYGGYASGVFDSNPAYSIYSADDFVIPAGTTWVITGFVFSFFTGEDYSVPTRDTKVDVGVFSDANGSPSANPDTVMMNADIHFSDDVNPSSVGVDIMTIPLAEPVVINACGGEETAWVSVAIDELVLDFGQWFWDMNGVTVNNEAQFINPGDGFGFGALNWTPTHTRLSSLDSVDHSFAVLGTVDATPCDPLAVSVSSAEATNNIAPTEIIVAAIFCIMLSASSLTLRKRSLTE